MFLALTRVLRDDLKKSLELSTNIIYIFFCFSTFPVFHPILITNKVALQLICFFLYILKMCKYFFIFLQVGSQSMMVLDHELKRYQSLLEDIELKRKQGEL